MKSPEERGALGAWAYNSRSEAHLSVPQVVDGLAARGVAVRDSTIRGIESGGKRPGRALLRQLAALYDSVPPGDTERPGSEDPGLYQRLDALTAAIGELASEAARDRARTAGAMTGIARALAILAKRDQVRDGTNGPTPRAGSARVPRKTGRR